MNHLAHCYLSFGDEDRLLGNFIGDYVKGKGWQDYTEGVAQGILLHRAIDAFTDSHAATASAKGRVRPCAGRFAGAAADILFDHLLTRHWEHYAAEDFSAFAVKTYRMLEKRAGEMPAPLQERLPRMIGADFLGGYRHKAGMAFVMERFAARLPLPMDWQGVLDVFWRDLAHFDADFNIFFPDLLKYIENKYHIKST